MTLAFKMQRLSQIRNATADMFMDVLKNRLFNRYFLIHLFTNPFIPPN